MAPIPPTLYPLGEEIDYSRLLVRTYTAWWNQAMAEVKQSLALFNDAAWSESLFERLSQSWPALVDKAKPLIDRIFKRVNDRTFIRFSKQVEVATRNGPQKKPVILALNPFYSEPWLDLFMSERIAENIRLINDIGNQAAIKMQQMLEDGIRSGKPTRAIIKELEKTFDYGKNRARLIARDQIGKHNGLLNELRQKNVGVEQYEWSTAGDERVRATHKARDGKIFNWDDPPIDGHPGQSVQCRCTALPVFPENIFEKVTNREN